MGREVQIGSCSCAPPFDRDREEGLAAELNGVTNIYITIRQTSLCRAHIRRNGKTLLLLREAEDCAAILLL